MKKKLYIAPQTESFCFQPQGPILQTSNLPPQDWGGGGSAGGRLFEDDGMDFIMGGGDFNDLQNMLLP